MANQTVWNALRYRLFWQTGDPPVFITECGRDRVRDGDSSINDGWIGNGGWIADGVSATVYLQELDDYDREIQQDGQVVGATVFTGGPTSDWANYSTDILDIPITEEPMPTDFIKDRLKDMWVRQGVDVAENDTVFQYCLNKAKTQGVIILPQFTQTGTWQNWSHERYVLCYTIPVPLYFERNVWEIKEGFPDDV